MLQVPQIQLNNQILLSNSSKKLQLIQWLRQTITQHRIRLFGYSSILNQDQKSQKRAYQKWFGKSFPKEEPAYKQKLCFLVYIIHFQVQLIKMKKNISKLIAQIERTTSATRKDTFKVTSRNANQYVNKILVESEAYNAPSIAEKYVKEEMKDFERANVNENVSGLNKNVSHKMGRPKGIEHQLNLFEKNYNLLALQELLASIREASKEEMFSARDKLIKLENSLCFSLENEELEPHAIEVLADFLAELTRIINKTHYVY